MLGNEKVVECRKWIEVRKLMGRCLSANENVSRLVLTEQKELNDEMITVDLITEHKVMGLPLSSVAGTECAMISV